MNDALLREHLAELDRYLCDQLPPLLVAESLEALLAVPAGVIARECQSWALQQFRVHESAIPLSDLLFHAVKKIDVVGELGLVPRDLLQSRLTEVKALLVRACPESERELLRANLERLGSRASALAPAVELLFRHQEEEGKPRRRTRHLPGKSVGAEEGPASEEVVRAIRRFNLLVERLEPRATEGTETPAGAEPGEALMAELFTSAAEGAGTDGELRALLAAAGLPGVDPRAMIRTLAEALPDWAAPEGKPEGASSPAGAMERLVSLGEHPREGAERFWELVRSGVDHANRGALGRAVAILDSAARLAAEGRVQSSAVDRVRATAHTGLDRERLRELATDPDRQPLLRRLLGFFPRLHPGPLLDELAGSEERQERRLLMSLVETHGREARPVVLAALERSVLEEQHPDAWQIQRNLVYLLRRLPMDADTPADGELDLVMGLTVLDRAAPLVREAVGYVGQVRSERAVGELVRRFREVEQALDDGAGVHPAEELRKLLSAVASALARSGSPAGHAEVVRHGLDRRPAWGATAERLAELAAADLSGEPALVGQLVEALRRALPLRVLGLTVERDTVRAAHLIAALSGTPRPGVGAALGRVARRYAGEEVGRLASEALERLAATPTPGTGSPGAAPASPAPGGGGRSSILEGDLDLFGLPTLLQGLAQARSSGELELATGDGETRARVFLANGKVVGCRRGRLEAEAAFYSLLEQPFSGTFTLRREGAPVGSLREPGEINALLFEGMRRYDELRRARLIVADGVSFTATGTSPSAPEDEDGTFVHDLWVRVKQGERADAIEEDVPVDPFRVRSLVARWVEEGALRPEPAAEG